LSGIAMDDVQVHYNSAKPAALQALAYAQGTDIYVGPSQERHLPHEAWHVVQQKQVRIKPTLQLKGQPINTDMALEAEAETMGSRAHTHGETLAPDAPVQRRVSGGVAQLRTIPGKVLSPTGAKVYKSIGIVNSDAIAGKRAAQGTRVWIDSEKSVEKYEHVTIDQGKLVDGSPIPVGAHGFVEGYINREKLEFAGAKAEEKQLQNVISQEVIDQVDAWLLAEAKSSGKEKLITEGGYAGLNNFRKVEVFRRAGVRVNVHDAASFKKLKSGIVSDKIDWVLFSGIVRRLNGNASASAVMGGPEVKSGQTPFATTNAEYVGYVGLGGGAAAATSSALAAQSEHPITNHVANIGTFQQAGAMQAMQGADIVGGALATVANIVEVHRIIEEWMERSSKGETGTGYSQIPYIVGLYDQIAQIGTSAGRIVATTAGVQGHFSLAEVGYENTASASAGHSALFVVGAQVTGACAAIAGAAKMAKGIYDVHEARMVLKNLAVLKETLTSPDFKLMLAQSQASQTLKRSTAGATIVQGAAMVAGGILVAVLATNPAGWTILGAAAIFGGAIAAYKYFQKKANKKKFVDRLLIKKYPDIVKKSDEELDEKVRKQYLHKLGYTKVDIFYNDIIAGFAAVTHAALSGPPADVTTREAIQLVTAWRMNPDPKKTTVQMIANKMHNG
ncbi:MAG: DUF4157 domain-containing protein, partial [Thermomicrobia bacterium]|nr:DUF4157 domain-containing protein [Thermomicrobia bacterium]